MDKVQFYVSEVGGTKGVGVLFDKTHVDLSPEEASALAMVYLSNQISTYLDRLNGKLDEICDKLDALS